MNGSGFQILIDHCLNKPYKNIIIYERSTSEMHRL